MSELGVGLSSPPTVGEIATALREDPVLVDDVLGNGDTAAVHEGFTQIVTSADVATYVVMTQPPAGLSGSDPTTDLATRLQQRLGEADATFAIELSTGPYGPSLVGLGDAPDVGDYYESREALGKDAESTYDDALSSAGRLARDLETLVRGPEMTSADWDAYASTEPWPAPAETDVTADPPWSPDTLFWPAVVAVVVAGSVWILLGGLRGLESAPRRGRAAARGAPGSPQRGSDAEAQATYAEVDDELSALDAQVARDGDRVGDARLRTRLEGSLDAAHRVMGRIADADAATARDLPDLLGARVLARQSRRALETGRRPRGGGSQSAHGYHCCFVDPRHGAARHVRELPVGSAGDRIRVPVCPQCRDAPTGELDWLLVRGRGLGRPRPYVETDSVWARTGFGGLVDELWQEVSDDLRTSSGRGAAR